MRSPEIKRHKNQLYRIIESEQPSELFSKTFNRYSDLHKLKRVFTYCCPYIDKSRSVNRRTEELTVSELEIAFTKLLNIAHSDSFNEEITLLARK